MMLGPDATRPRRPLWRCPKCGHRFVTRHCWHSCRRVPVAEHFRGKDPAIRQLYSRFAALVRRCGPVTAYAQKTRIVFQSRARFAGVTPRHRWLDVTLWLKRRVESRRIRRIESLAGRDFIHHLRIQRLSDLDAELASLVRKAYAVGSQAYGRPGTDSRVYDRLRVDSRSSSRQRRIP